MWRHYEPHKYKNEWKCDLRLQIPLVRGIKNKSMILQNAPNQLTSKIQPIDKKIKKKSSGVSNAILGYMPQEWAIPPLLASCKQRNSVSDDYYDQTLII